ncbi:MAG TPA: carbohydrate-binding protein [Tepidisphaeraceae bacterium]
MFSLERLESRELLTTAPWGAQAKLIGQDLAVADYPNLTGAGEAIAIIDSGVDYKHPALGGGMGPSFKVVTGYDFAGGDADPMPDTLAHGTGAAGIAAANSYVYDGYRYQGIAPGARIIALRENSTGGVKAALDWVLNNRGKYNIVAINMTDFGGASPTLYRDVLKQLIAAGVFVTYPAGNNGAGVPISAAVDPAEFAIGSVNLSGQISAFSQRGAELDLLAPGEKVTLPYYDVNTRANIYLDTADGTSWASPAVAGAAALIRQIDPRFTPAQIMRIMQDSGVAVYDPVSKLTYKRLNLRAALALAYQRRTVTPQAPDSSSSGPIVVPPAPTASQSPFSSTPITIGRSAAATIQAEDFDNGGEGVAYHDSDSANRGGSSYRKGTGVDVQDAGGGGRYVGFVSAGEWLEYTVNVSAAGTYTLGARVSSLKAGGKFHVEVDGVDKTGALSVPRTGGWQAWTNVSKTGVALGAGTHVIRIKADAGGALGYVANFDSITVTPASVAVSAASVQAAAYSAQSGVSNKTSFVGSLDAGDWVAYKGIDFGQQGVTSLTASVAAANGWGGKTLQFRLDSPKGAVIGTLTVPSTGGWTTFKTVKIAIAKIANVRDLYVTVPGGNGVGNLQWLRFA